MLESHVPGNSQAWFGEGQLEKGQYMEPRWLPTPLRSGQIRLTESAGLECYMSEAALALTGDETASPNSGESRSIIFVFTINQNTHQEMIGLRRLFVLAQSGRKQLIFVRASTYKK
jgi:hypothetical protein